MKKLQDYNYKQLATSRRGDEYQDVDKEGKEIVLRYLGDNGKFVYLISKEGEVKACPNPEWYAYYLKVEKEKKRLEDIKKDEIRNTPKKLDAIDKRHAKKMADEYDGDLEKDLLQPFLPTGETNPKFVKAYGEEPLKNAVRKKKGKKL